MRRHIQLVLFAFVCIAGMSIFGISAEAKYKKTCNYHYEKCNRGCYNDYSYCYSHKCRHSSCKNAHSRYGQYCSEHTCKKDGCYAETAGSYEYCRDHLSKQPSGLCSVYGCKRKPVSGSKYCSTHECSVSGCHAYATGKGKCYKHGHSNSSSEKKSNEYDEDEAYELWEEMYG